jgi:hypothetical protein
MGEPLKRISVGFLLVNNDEGPNYLSLWWSKGAKVSFEDPRLSSA